jgi:hypothetical protein
MSGGTARVTYTTFTLIHIAVGRAVASPAESPWMWRDWIALAVAWFGATQLVMVFAPPRYLALLQQRRASWTKEDQEYADSWSDRRWWLLMLCLLVCYGAIFVSFGPVGADSTTLNGVVTIWVLSVVATVVASFGIVGRGSHSLYVASVGSTAWLVLLGFAFWQHGWKSGLLLFVSTALLSNMLQSVFRRLMFGRHYTNRQN